MNIKRSLKTKLIFQYMVIVIVCMLVIPTAISELLDRQFRGFATERLRENELEVAEFFAKMYIENGSWQGCSLFPRGSDFLRWPMVVVQLFDEKGVEVRKYSRILQIGSQQRSDAEFIHAANLCREGELGKIGLIKVHVGGSPTPYTLPKQEVPAGLNWDKWLGPLPETIYYNSDLNPVITIDPEQNEQLWGAWRWYQGMGGGLMTDWGAHMFDIAQWAMGKDGNGPVEIIPAGYSYYDHLTYKYDNGTTVTEQEFDGGKQGLKIYGDNGWIQVCRGEFLASDPKFMPKAEKQQDSSVPYETKVGHYQTFINSMRSRIDPNVPVEVGHSSCTVCNLGNIANELKRPVVWNPIVEKFMNDPEATKRMHYQYRDGYSLDV